MSIETHPKLTKIFNQLKHKLGICDAKPKYCKNLAEYSEAPNSPV